LNKKSLDANTSFVSLVSNKQMIPYHSNNKSANSLEYSVHDKNKNNSLINQSLFNDSNVNNLININDDSFMSNEQNDHNDRNYHNELNQYELNGQNTLDKSNNITSLSLSKSNLNLDTDRYDKFDKLNTLTDRTNGSQISNLSNRPIQMSTRTSEIPFVSHRSQISNLTNNRTNNNHILSVDSNIVLKKDISLSNFSNITSEFFLNNRYNKNTLSIDDISRKTTECDQIKINNNKPNQLINNLYPESIQEIKVNPSVNRL